MINIRLVGGSLYLLKSGNIVGNNGINSGLNNSTKNIVKKIFGPYAASCLLIGQNFVQKERIDPELAKEFPAEILDQKFLLHPVRLSICKLLSEYPTITSMELRGKLGVSWSDFSAHTKALKEKGFIHLEERVIDGSFRQIISFEPIGLEKYENLVDILIEFIDKSSIYNRYLDEALKFSEDSN